MLQMRKVIINSTPLIALCKVKKQSMQVIIS